MRRIVAISSLLFSFVFLVFASTAFAQIGVGISVNFGPPPLPVYEQPLCLPMAISGSPVTGPMTMKTAIIGFRARGWNRPKLVSFGRQRIGAGETVRSFSMKDTGVQKWVFMGASIMDLATVVLVTRAVAGKAITFPTTPMSLA